MLGLSKPILLAILCVLLLVLQLLFTKLLYDNTITSNEKQYIDHLRYALQRIQSKTRSKSCQQRINDEYLKYIESYTRETPFPFENIFYRSQCNTSLSLTSNQFAITHYQVLVDIQAYKNHFLMIFYRIT